ncbi:hypothetical protein D3C87_1436920 [compost metagenome]
MATEVEYVGKGASDRARQVADVAGLRGNDRHRHEVLHHRTDASAQGLGRECAVDDVAAALVHADDYVRPLQIQIQRKAPFRQTLSLPDQGEQLDGRQLLEAYPRTQRFGEVDHQVDGPTFKHQ